MAEGRMDFADWVGEAVMVFYPGGAGPAEYGVLEEVNDWGLVLRRDRWIHWAPRGPDERRESDFRTVYEFHPWHIVNSVRVLEPEEQEYHGL
jgi:hypothetical protein